MASPTPGSAYCIVKSCPVGTCSYVQMVNATGGMDFGRPNTIVILPHQRQFSTLEPIAVVEELRSILADEATLLDAATKSVWRLEIDSLTVLNTISKLGFYASHFDVSSMDGVHTWTMTSSLTDTKVACDPNDANKVISASKPKPIGQKRKLGASSMFKEQKHMQHAPHDDFDSLHDENDSRSLSSKRFAGSNSVASSPADPEMEQNRIPDESVAEKRSLECVKAENGKYLMPAEQSFKILRDFLTEDIIPPKTREIFYTAHRQPVGMQANRIVCHCEGGRCKSKATVAGRRYCHFAVDKSLRKSLKNHSGLFQTSTLCRYLLNSVYEAKELSVLTVGKSKKRPASSSTIYYYCYTGQFVLIPPEHLSDLQYVLTEYWNAYVRNCTKPITDEFFNRRAPTRVSVQKHVRKLITDTRSRFLSSLGMTTKTMFKPKSNNKHSGDGKSSHQHPDDEEENEQLSNTTSDAEKSPTQNESESEKGKTAESFSIQKQQRMQTRRRKLATGNSHAAAVVVEQPSILSPQIYPVRSKLRKKLDDEDEDFDGDTSSSNLIPAKRPTSDDDSKRDATVMKKFLLSEAGPKQRNLYDFLQNPKQVVPSKTLKHYWPTYPARRHVPRRTPLCVCKGTQCKSHATVVGRRYCHYSVDRVYESVIKSGEIFKSSLLIRTLFGMVYTNNELCCLTLRACQSDKFVPMPTMHLADLQFILVEYWNCFVENALTSSKIEMTDEDFNRYAPTMANVTTLVQKTFTDARIRMKNKNNKTQKKAWNEAVSDNEENDGSPSPNSVIADDENEDLPM